LRGLFLGCGSVSDPEKEYHLEFVAGGRAARAERRGAAGGAEIPARMAARKGKHVAYIGEADHISELLALAGGASGDAQIGEAYAWRRREEYRQPPGELRHANADKTVKASGRQIESIRRIEERGGLSHLPRELREAAQARLENPDVTLEGLAQAMGVSKSGLNHRFRRIEEIAGEYRNKEDTRDEPQKSYDPKR